MWSHVFSHVERLYSWYFLTFSHSFFVTEFFLFYFIFYFKLILLPGLVATEATVDSNLEEKYNSSFPLATDTADALFFRCSRSVCNIACCTCSWLNLTSYHYANLVPFPFYVRRSKASLQSSQWPEWRYMWRTTDDCVRFFNAFFRKLEIVKCLLRYPPHFIPY